MLLIDFFVSVFVTRRYIIVPAYRIIQSIALSSTSVRQPNIPTTRRRFAVEDAGLLHLSFSFIIFIHFC